jgi:hypothetical protein
MRWPCIQSSWGHQFFGVVCVPCPLCSLNQLLRLYAHHNLPLRLTRLLPRLLPAAAAAAAAAEAAAAGGAPPPPTAPPRHARTASYQAGDAEVALLADDALAAAAASLALTRGGGGGDDDGAAAGYASPGSRSLSPGRQRWLSGLSGRGAPGSPSRRGDAACPAAASRVPQPRRLLMPSTPLQTGFSAKALQVPPLSVLQVFSPPSPCFRRRLSRLRSGRGGGGGSAASLSLSLSPDRSAAGSGASTVAGSWGAPGGGGGAVPAVSPEAEAARKLGTLVDGIFNLLAGGCRWSAAPLPASQFLCPSRVPACTSLPVFMLCLLFGVLPVLLHPSFSSHRVQLCVPPRCGLRPSCHRRHSSLTPPPPPPHKHTHTSACHPPPPTSPTVTTHTHTLLPPSQPWRTATPP